MHLQRHGDGSTLTHSFFLLLFTHGRSKNSRSSSTHIFIRVALTSVTRQEVQFLRIISQMHEQGLRKQNGVCLDSYIAATALHAHG